MGSFASELDKTRGLVNVQGAIDAHSDKLARFFTKQNS